MGIRTIRKRVRPRRIKITALLPSILSEARRMRWYSTSDWWYSSSYSRRRSRRLGQKVAKQRPARPANVAQNTQRDFGEWVQAGKPTGWLDLGTVRRRPASLTQRGADVWNEPPAFMATPEAVPRGEVLHVRLGDLRGSCGEKKRPWGPCVITLLLQGLYISGS